MWKKFNLLIVGFAVIVSGCKNDGSAPGQASITPQPVATLVSLSLSPENQYVARSSPFKLKAMGVFSDSTLSEVKTNLIWTIDDSSVATIAADGTLTNTWIGSLNNATRLINVTATHSTGINAVTKVTILSASISNFIINPTNLSVAPGSQTGFSVIANLSDGSTMDISSTASATVSNSNASVSDATLTGVNVGTGTLNVLYNGVTVSTPFTVAEGASSGGTTSGIGLRGDYYNGTNFETFFGTRTDASINFTWNADVNNVGQTENYSIRWTGFIQAQKSETYTFYTQADDGTRLSINGVPFASCINDWTVHGVTERTCATTFALAAGQKVAITLEYFEGPGVSSVKLLWSSPTTAKQVVPQAYLYLPN